MPCLFRFLFSFKTDYWFKYIRLLGNCKGLVHKCALVTSKAEVKHTKSLCSNVVSFRITDVSSRITDVSCRIACLAGMGSLGLLVGVSFRITVFLGLLVVSFKSLGLLLDFFCGLI